MFVTAFRRTNNCRDDCNSRDENEMRGSLHCATDDETVRCFGRDDEFVVAAKKKNGQRQSQPFCGRVRSTERSGFPPFAVRLRRMGHTDVCGSDGLRTGNDKGKCGGLSTAQRTMEPSAASVEMTNVCYSEKKNGQR